VGPRPSLSGNSMATSSRLLNFVPSNHASVLSQRRTSVSSTAVPPGSLHSQAKNLTHELLARLQAVRSPTLHPEVDGYIQEFEAMIWTHKNYVQNMPLANPRDIFTNGELRLDELDVLGFDYDYTLASYTDRVQYFIYDQALKYLIEVHGYPRSIAGFTFDPTFAVRGLHYDTKRGNVMKLDYLNLIQADTVYSGRVRLSQERLHSAYPSLFIPRKYGEENLRPMSDIFCLPEVCLISDIIQHLNDLKVTFDPAYVYEDIRKAVEHIHFSRLLHNEIISNLPTYLEKNPSLGEILWRFRDSGKQLFLATNSPFYFVAKGMEYLLDGQLPKGFGHWTEMFDLIITSCDKPSFFIHNRSFRVINPETGHITWDRPRTHYKGQVLVEGSLTQLVNITGWKGDRVLYFGDHLFNDLKEPSIVAGWKTGVIIKELEREVGIQNLPDYRTLLAELMEVEAMMRKCMFFSGEANEAVVWELRQHRDKLRKVLKDFLNPNFGSVFRTHRHASSFAFQVQRYANVYTSKLENFLNYPTHYIFYPERNFLPHEAKIPSSALWRTVCPVPPSRLAPAPAREQPLDAS
jgi:HAD superfamily 5'-nucleotidase-like hydrolase